MDDYKFQKERFNTSKFQEICRGKDAKNKLAPSTIIISLSFAPSIVDPIPCYLSASAQDDQTLHLPQKPSSQIFYRVVSVPSADQKFADHKQVHYKAYSPAH